MTFSGTGAPVQLVGPSQSLLSPTTDITVQDTVTWVKGAHTLRSGFLYTRNRKDQNGRFAHTGAVNFNPSGNPMSTGLAFADALLGNFRTYSEGADDPLGFFRFTQYGGFVSDNWRVRRDLSFEVGLRYELASPTYTQANNISNFDPALYDPDTAVRLNRNGSIIPNSGNPYIGLIRAGDGIPADEEDRVTLDPAAAPLIPTGAPRGLFGTDHLLMPRFSGAYTLREVWVIRGGIGLFYDKPEGNIIFSQVNLPPFVPSVAVENANLANPLSGQASAAAVLGTINAIDPVLDVPRQLNYSVSVQRELPYGHFAEIAYVGNQGRDLLWQPEINQPSFEVLAANAALPAADRANTNFLRPYRGYSSIRQRRSDAFSDYNGLQLYLNKRRGDLNYTIGYTLSKATGLGSGNGDNPLAAEGYTPGDVVDLDFFVGPTTYDRRHVLISTWTYRVPFFRGRGNLAEVHARGLGTERQDPLAVGAEPDGDGKHLYRHPPCGLSGRGDRSAVRRARREPLVQHRGVRRGSRHTPRQFGNRHHSGTALGAVGPVAAEDVPDLAREARVPRRRVQRIQPRQLQQPEHDGDRRRIRAHLDRQDSAADAVQPAGGFLAGLSTAPAKTSNSLQLPRRSEPIDRERFGSWRLEIGS